jgi:chromosome transmission fidelity protein 8
MRIQIEIPPSLIKRPAPPASAPPLVQIGGEMVIMELQGDLTFEGEPGGKVIGLLGLERMVSRGADCKSSSRAVKLIEGLLHERIG